MRRNRTFLWITAAVSVCALFGCGTPGDDVDVKKLQAELKDAGRQNLMLQQDNGNLKRSLEQTEASLAEVSNARNNLDRQVKELTQAREDLTAQVGELNTARIELQKKVADLTQSRDELQTNVESLTATRTSLQHEVDDLTKAKNVALDDAKSAQLKIEQLNAKLRIQAQQVAELQAQIANVRTVLDRLQ